MKKIFALLIAFVSIAIISCDKSDDNDLMDDNGSNNSSKLTEENLLGRWVLERYYDYDEDFSGSFDITDDMIESGNVNYYLDFKKYNKGHLRWMPNSITLGFGRDLDFKWNLEHKRINVGLVKENEYKWYIDKFDGQRMTISFDGSNATFIKTMYQPQ